MGETSAKSMRGSGMEDVIFSGTSNKASKNIAEVSIEVENKDREGPIQYRETEQIQVRRKIEKDKGSKFYINDKEVRARDAQMFFADLSTGAHSPSMISQGRIGALVTAKPTDRRAILEEAAGISGLHVRRHEAELRLGAAENNLKRADELRRQQEKQLANLQKQAEEATKYKLISDQIKKIEAGLYYLKLLEIDKEIRIENEINTEAEGEVEGFNNKISELENSIKTFTDKVNPLREKNIENLSRIQRLNLELQSLDEENTRIQDEIESIKKSIQTLDDDITREKGIIIDANSNEKRLKEEKTELIETDSKYFETEKLSNEELDSALSNSSLDNFSVSKYFESVSINSVFSSFNLFSFELASIIIPFSLVISSSSVWIDFLMLSISSWILVFSSSKLWSSKLSLCILDKFSIFFSLNGFTLSVKVLIEFSNSDILLLNPSTSPSASVLISFSILISLSISSNFK